VPAVRQEWPQTHLKTHRTRAGVHRKASERRKMAWVEQAESDVSRQGLLPTNRTLVFPPPGFCTLSRVLRQSTIHNPQSAIRYASPDR